MEEILKQIALENRTTVGSVKKEIEFAIHEAMNNSQTDSKNFWNELSYDGKGPVWWLPQEIMWDKDNIPNEQELEEMKAKLLAALG